MASFVVIPFAIVLTYGVPQDWMVFAFEVIIGAGLVSGIILALLFVVSTFLDALGGGRRR